jgi:GTPase
MTLRFVYPNFERYSSVFCQSIAPQIFPYLTYHMSLPIVAIIGRPNVGKSALVNRLAGALDAIVHDEAGVTRDRTYRRAFWGDREYTVVDTGGLVFDDETEFLPLIREQAFAALSEASVAIMVVDGQMGRTAGDEEIATWLRHQKLPVLLAVNKCESETTGLLQSADFGRWAWVNLLPFLAFTVTARVNC